MSWNCTFSMYVGIECTVEVEFNDSPSVLVRYPSVWFWEFQFLVFFRGLYKVSLMKWLRCTLLLPRESRCLGVFVRQTLLDNGYLPSSRSSPGRHSKCSQALCKESCCIFSTLPSPVSLFSNNFQTCSVPFPLQKTNFLSNPNIKSSMCTFRCTCT